MRMLRATWSIRDELGELVAHGTQNLDRFADPVGRADPYEPALQLANAVECALINYLPSIGRADLERHLDEPLLFEGLQ